MGDYLQRQRGSDSAQWEVGGAARTRAPCPACSPPAAHPQTHPLSPPFLSRMRVLLQASWGLKAPAAHRGPRVCSSEIQLQSPPGGSRRLHNQECPSSPPCPGQAPLGSSVAPMKAEGRDLQGGGRLQAGRICPRGNLGEEAPGLCTQRWAWRPLWGKDK